MIINSVHGLVEKTLGGSFALPDFITANLPFAGSSLVGFRIGFKVG